MTPKNILLLDDALQGRRWVMADWGLVRRPAGETTAKHTQRGALLGTEGFAPPESYLDAHAFTAAGDVYGLGRVVAWATTGRWPAPNAELPSPGLWRRFVVRTTTREAHRRPQSMAALLELVAKVGEDVPNAHLPTGLLKRAKGGDVSAAAELFRFGLDHLDEGEMFIDEIAQVSGPPLARFVALDLAGAQQLVQRMAHHLEELTWGRRDFDYYNVPLGWIMDVAEAARSAGHLDLMEEAAELLFQLEPPLDRWPQRRRTVEWLRSLKEDAAVRIAEVLRDHATACQFYGRIDNAASIAIRSVLRG